MSFSRPSTLYDLILLVRPLFPTLPVFHLFFWVFFVFCSSVTVLALEFGNLPDASDGRTLEASLFPLIFKPRIVQCLRWGGVLVFWARYRRSCLVLHLWALPLLANDWYNVRILFFWGSNFATLMLRVYLFLRSPCATICSYTKANSQDRKSVV